MFPGFSTSSAKFLESVLCKRCRLIRTCPLANDGWKTMFLSFSFGNGPFSGGHFVFSGGGGGYMFHELLLQLSDDGIGLTKNCTESIIYRWIVFSVSMFLFHELWEKWFPLNHTLYNCLFFRGFCGRVHSPLYLYIVSICFLQNVFYCFASLILPVFCCLGWCMSCGLGISKWESSKMKDNTYT